MNFSNKRSIPVLVLCLLVLSYFLYSSTISLFPSFIHAWTQSDRYAIALQFLDNGFDLFHPATFNLQTVEGITRVDFPINEFFVAILMKIFGTTPIVFRVYSLGVSIVGLIYLYLLAKRITSSEIKSWLVVFFVFLSPVYAYYQIGFLPSIPAIAAIFAAYYYFFSYKESNSPKQFKLAILFFTLAALMRFPFVIVLFAVLAQQGWLMLKAKRVNKSEWAVLFSSFVIFGAYYMYNVHLGRMYGNMFLDSLMPARSLSEFKAILKEIYHHWFLQYFSIWQYYLLALVMILCTIRFFKRKGIEREHKKYWFHLFIISSGTGLYFLVMTRQFYAHDYYFLDSLFVPTVLAFLFSINEVLISSLKQQLVWALLFLSAVFLFYTGNTTVQAERYVTGPWDRMEITRQNFSGTENYLDSIGVAKDAKILVIDAYTTNVPLILMNRKGYTILGTTAKNISISLAWCKWDYVAIQDIYLISDVIKGYPPITAMLKRIGGNGKVSFYVRSEKIEPKALKQFLGIKSENTVFRFFKNAETNTLKLDPSIEYGVTASVKAADLKNERNLKVLVNADILFTSELKDIQIIAAVSSGTEQIYYQNFDLKGYFKPSALSQKMEFQFVLPDFKTPEDELKVYFWNPSKQEMVYDNFEVIVYK